MKRLALILALSLFTAQPASAYREPVISDHFNYTIKVIDRSSYQQEINYLYLQKYLATVDIYWDIYQGSYTIYIDDYLYGADIYNISPSALAYHIVEGNNEPVAYVNYQAFKDYEPFGFDIYLGLTHELAEMAVNPYIWYFDKNGHVVEICDDMPWVLIEGHWVADFKTPKDYNL